jgi:hypothetical protein
MSDSHDWWERRVLSMFLPTSVLHLITKMVLALEVQGIGIRIASKL